MNGALPSFAKSGPLGTVNGTLSADEDSLPVDSSTYASGHPVLNLAF